jgi:hypothetical protein
VALDRHPAEVVLAIRIIVGIELIIAPQRREDLALGLGPERRNRSRDHDAAAAEVVRKESLRARIRSVLGSAKRQWLVMVSSGKTASAIDGAALDGVWHGMDG